MTLTVAPKTALAPTPPAVGIFWRVNAVLVVERSTLEQAEAYGDCLGHAGGHYERWQEWRSLGETQLTAFGYPAHIASTEYDQWPRGRIVYETFPKRFLLYADRRLQSPEVIDSLKAVFGLNEVEVIVRSDLHYR